LIFGGSVTGRGGATAAPPPLILNLAYST
jgi:hypothetical protein